MLSFGRGKRGSLRGIGDEQMGSVNLALHTKPYLSRGWISHVTRYSVPRS